MSAKRISEKIQELYGRYAVLYADPRKAVLPMLLGILGTGSAHDADIYLERIQNVSSAHLQAIAEKYLSPMALSASGALDEKGKLLQK